MKKRKRFQQEIFNYGRVRSEKPEKTQEKKRLKKRGKNGKKGRFISYNDKING